MLRVRVFAARFGVLLATSPRRPGGSIETTAPDLGATSACRGAYMARVVDTTRRKRDANDDCGAACTGPGSGTTWSAGQPAGAESAGDLGEHFGATLTAREVDWMINHEFARTAEDVLWRRSKLGLRLSGETARFDPAEPVTEVE